jgi:four helix bundle protein
MKMRHFRDLTVWQKSMDLAGETYSLTKDFPKAETFGLVAQMRRAAVSVPSNIAEGHGRLSDRSFAVFLSQARGSLYELETQMDLASQLGFVPPERCRDLIGYINEVARLLNGLLSVVRPSVSPGRAPTADC